MCPQETIGLYQSRLTKTQGKAILLNVHVKILGKGCDWPNLDHVIIPKPMTEAGRLRAPIGWAWVTHHCCLRAGHYDWQPKWNHIE